MIPGEFRIQPGDLEINQDRKTISLIVVNKGDRPIQVGSHFHFYEVNKAMHFDRSAAFGMRLNIPAGTAVRFEPGEEKPVELVSFRGFKRVFGLNGLTSGPMEPAPDSLELNERILRWKGEADHG
ncbi:urease subunit beta [Ferviditalea candida]|uniref:Urease subunit beta n=1 Tax=Ferviditalea candida TaxID=3108399 RepID=A0ABU5ZPM6_9BACL|nr:urease subunit beta [Paenibacillaceae bacterium T2]